jgi:monoamine oxidase
VTAKLSRREFVKRGAAGGAALALAPLAACGGGGSSKHPRVVIVGAGLAGLSCGYRLSQRGVPCTIYEANAVRVGGRCWTSREWAEGQTAEHGGEFIDSRHRRIRRLCREFGLELEDLYAEDNPGRTRIWLNGALRARGEMAAQRDVFYRRLERAARRVGSYHAANPTLAARAFDRLSAADWLERNVPGGGAASLWGQFVWAQLASEFGLDADRLSALNLFAEFIEAAPGADERFHIRGGNDGLVDALAAGLHSTTIEMNSPLEAVTRASDGSVRLTFAGAGQVSADELVLAIPFTTLRRVELAGAGLSAKKRACIAELGMGTNAKVLMQFDRRPRRYGNWNGYLASDDPFLLTWESTLRQPGRASIITTYFGGRSGAAGLSASGAHAETIPRETTRNLMSLSEGGDTGLRGLVAGFNGRAWTDRWASDPWARGSYAAFLPGQYTRYFGYTGKPDGPIHFAGEHTATTNQGYLEGAVESGERAANEVLARIA